MTRAALPVPVDIGLFAHDEAAGIAAMLAGLAAQDIWADTGLAPRLVVLANGCSDDTAAVARASLAAFPPGALAEVAELAEGGKSRTWNAFVHRLARPGAAVLVFCDADIALPEAGTLAALVRALLARPELDGFTSRPVKDLSLPGARLTPVERLIAAGGGTLDDWRSAICGQLYALRAGVARGFHLPVGLPVEDGFVRAMVMTRAFSDLPGGGRIDGDPAIFHVYASERRIAGLIRHQTRIVVGGAVNAAVFAHLVALPGAPAAIPAELARAAADPGWLARVLAAQLPRWPWGWVPLHFLTKRIANLVRAPRALARPRGLAVLVAGFSLDLVVWVRAQWRMARGGGPGFW